MRLIYPSILKYFSGLIFPILWINTHNNLPQSNAGIGKILNIASASEIIPANAKYSFHHPESNKASQSLITPAGPVNLLSDVFILFHLMKVSLFLMSLVLIK